MSQFPLYHDNEVSLPREKALDNFLAFVATQKLELYEAQEEAIIELFEGSNVILSTPTGSGKSLVALALHYESLTAGRRSVYTSPVKALVNEKFFALCKSFGPRLVGLVTGDATVNPYAPILCCTAEIIANRALRHHAGAVCDDLIMDEFHYYGDRERGIAWQIPLIFLKNTRFLLMSATLGDVTFFLEVLTKLNGLSTKLVASKIRPVPLTFHYNEETLEESIADLVTKKQYPIYIVNFTQKECAVAASGFLSVNLTSKEEKAEISKHLVDYDFNTPYGKEIQKLLKHGIGLHHAGLLPKYRILVESLAQRGFLKLIFGTDTLGVGVNIPIRVVILTKLCKYDGHKTGLLSVREFHQISGRAGRKGFDDQGSVYVQAPLHAIENKKLELKSKINPKLKKKPKAKPPEKGYVHWNEETMYTLINSEPEILRSSFQINHGIILNILGREDGGFEAFKYFLRNNHESEKSKIRFRHLAFQMLRALIQKKIIDVIPKQARLDNPFRVNFDLGEDFTITQTLSLYLLDTLKKLDPFSEDYSLSLLTLVESIIEHPHVILQKQLDRAKDIAIAHMKEQGLEFDQRMEELEKVEYPKPMKDFIYNTFNEFVSKHPWVGEENIRPKSIVREMFETYQSFSDYIKEYHLERSEGILLRYLSSVYKVLFQTIPSHLKDDRVDEVGEYLKLTIRATDSSLLDEWEKLSDPNRQSGSQSAIDTIKLKQDEDVTRNKKLLMIDTRNIVFFFIKELSARRYEEARFYLANKELWTIEKLSKSMDSYFLEHDFLCVDSNARNPKNYIVREESQTEILLEVIMIDPKAFNDWSMSFSLDLQATKDAKKPVISLLDLKSI